MLVRRHLMQVIAIF